MLAVFKITNILSEATAVHRLASVHILDPIHSGRFHITSGNIQVGNRIKGRDMRIFSMGAAIRQAQVIPSGKRQWIVNHRIDLRMFNKYIKLFYPKWIQYLCS